MIHEKIKITHEQNTSILHTYILENFPVIDPNRKRPFVIICPGGGYQYTSDREAEAVAIKLNALGLHACILRYSAPAIFPTALCQLAKTVGLIREQAKQWNVDVTRIIVMGFSAGGHLAASLGVFWNKSFLLEKLGYPKEQIKPNGLVLSYPVISSGEFAHQGSFQALTGEQYQNKELQELLSLEKQVSKDTPPTFLWHTVTDKSVPVQNSLLFADALLKHGVSFEMHIYPKGAHGLSLGTEETMAKDNEFSVQPEVSNWIEMAGRWIQGL
ncbi:alpha/beta hydrolase [Fredinandcohnia humi]